MVPNRKKNEDARCCQNWNWMINWILFILYSWNLDNEMALRFFFSRKRNSSEEKRCSCKREEDWRKRRRLAGYEVPTLADAVAEAPPPPLPPPLRPPKLPRKPLTREENRFLNIRNLNWKRKKQSMNKELYKMKNLLYILEEKVNIFLWLGTLSSNLLIWYFWCQQIRLKLGKLKLGTVRDVDFLIQFSPISDYYLPS